MKIFGEFIEKFVDINYTDEMFKNYMEKLRKRNITPMMVKGVLLNEKEKRKDIMQSRSKAASSEIDDIDIVLSMLQTYIKNRVNQRKDSQAEKIKHIRNTFMGVDSIALDISYAEMEKRVAALNAPVVLDDKGKIPEELTWHEKLFNKEMDKLAYEKEKYLKERGINMRQKIELPKGSLNHNPDSELNFYTELSNRKGPRSRLQDVKEHIHSRKCDCGAKHTAFPNAHSHWCSAKVWS